MKPKKPPKLYAIYGPDGERKTMPEKTKGWAWAMMPGAGITVEANTKRLKRLGYTCDEVEIVRVQR